MPTTAAPATAAFEAAYRSCGQAEVVAIHLSASLSAILAAARLGAEPLGDQVTLVDSQQASRGMGWQVLAAAEAAEAGGSRDEVLQAVRSVLEILEQQLVVVSLLRDVLGCGTNCYNMQIPGHFLAAPEPLRRALLTGLLRGDGDVHHVHKQRIYQKNGRYYRHKINAATVGPDVVLPVELIVRESCGCPHRPDPPASQPSAAVKEIGE